MGGGDEPKCAASTGSRGTGRRRVATAALAGIGVLSLLLRAFWPVGPSVVAPSKDTTYLLGPLNDDGTVDYVAALNATLGEGVTDGNNAVCLMLRALGPGALRNEETRAEVLDRLGLADLPDEGNYLVHLFQCLEENLTVEELGAPPQTEEVRRAAEVLRRGPKVLPGGLLGGDDYMRALELAPSIKAAAARKRARAMLEKAARQPWEASEYPLLAAWLASSEKALDLVVSASRRPRWYVPVASRHEPPRLHERDIIAFNWSLRAVADALACRAMLKLRRGDAGRALEDTLALHRLARLPLQERWLLPHMHGVALEEAACRADIAIAGSGRLSASQAREALSRLRAFPPWPDSKDAFDFGERCSALDALTSTFRAAGGARASGFDVNLMLRHVNEWYDRMIACYDTQGFAARRAAFEQVSDECVETITRYVEKHSGAFGVLRMILATSAGTRRIRSLLIANVVLSMAFPSAARGEDANAEAEAFRRLAETAFALAAYRAEKGSCPGRLDVLCPGFLPEVPRDPFTDEPLRYRREGEGYALYSVGRDMKDDGGDDERDTVARAGRDGQADAKRFLKGGDVSYLLRVEESGGVFREGGRARDALEILKRSGMNFARMRLFVEPDGKHGARSDLDYALRLARRIEAAGLGMLLCIHYSDTWADPGHQTKPAAWKDLPFPGLKEAVRDYSREVVTAFRKQGTLPEVVQVGNEVTGGFLWPDGKTWGEDAGGWAQFAELVRAGQEGVRSALASGEKVTFLHHIDNHAKARWHLDNLLAQEAKVEFDVLGLSYYPWWHGDIDSLEASLDDLSRRYEKDVMIVETAHPWTTRSFDARPNLYWAEKKPTPDFPPTKEGQRQFAARLLDAVKAVPGGRGRGVLWWEPEWIAMPDAPEGSDAASPVDNVTLFDEKGEALPALAAFSGHRPRSP